MYMYASIVFLKIKKNLIWEIASEEAASASHFSQSKFVELERKE